MTPLAVPCAATSTLPAVNIHPHGGHKKGALLDPFTQSSSNTAAQLPVGSTQNLFGSLFNSLRQIIGAQPASVAKSATSPSNAAGSSATANSAVAGAAAAAGAKINLMA